MHIYISILTIFLTMGFKSNRPSIRSELHSITQNIDQHITQADRICKYIWKLCFFTLDLKVDIPDCISLFHFPRESDLIHH